MLKKLLVNIKKSFLIDDNTLQDSLSFIEETLKEIGLDNKLVLRAVLLAEEMITQLINHSSKGNTLRVQVKRHLGDISVVIRGEGEQFDPFETSISESNDMESLEDEEAQQAIRSILLKSYGDKLKVSYKNGINQVRILADQSNQQMIIKTVMAIIFGLIFGLLMKFVLPIAITNGIVTYLLSPIRTMFMNALKIVIGPVVFFSIVTCIAQFKNLSELGRIGLKVMGMYLLTTVIAVLLAMGISSLLHPGTPGFALELGEHISSGVVNTDVDTSLLNTIINIVPSNFIKPFVESNTLQIIFLAILCGVGVGMIGEYASVLHDFFEACNSLFLTITTLISRFIPLVVFCSISMMTVNMTLSSMAAVLGYAGTDLLSLGCMIIIYGLLILIFARLNPITFFKKNREGMLTSMMLSSSSAAMPTNMRVCTEKLGISPKVSSFSIPLGATINMDGTCIFLMVSALFLARAYNVDIAPSGMISLIITIILLSLGCPGVPGSGIVCLGIVLTNIGVPIEAIGLVMAINPFIDMFGTMSNTTGDVAASLIVAKSEKLIDLDIYNN